MEDGERDGQMASPDDSPNSSPPNPSFRITPRRKFLRTISTKEPSFAEIFPPTISPPRLSNPTLPTSPLSSPLRRFTASKTAAAAVASEASYRCISSLLKKDGQILSIAVSGNLMYTGSEQNVIRVWKLPELIECDRLKTKASMAIALAVSNDMVYAAFADFKIRVWRRVWDGRLKHVRLGTIPKTGGYVRSYIAGKDKMVKHLGPITSLAVSTADDILYSSSVDRTVKVWRISDLRCIETFHAHPDAINALLVAEDDGVLFTASDDATVRVWRRDLCGGSRPHSLTVTLPAKQSPVKSLSLSPDSDALYGGCSDGYVHFWLKGWFSGQLQYGGCLQGHTHAVLCMASVGNVLVTASADLTSRVWARSQDGQHCCLAVLVGHRGPIRCVAAYHEGPMPSSSGGADGDGQLGSGDDHDREDGCTMICTGSLDGVLKLWKVTNSVNSSARDCSSKAGTDYFDI
ncbi:protein JINGUBANG-like [Rhodamnia argentea]|uniref:Protein JINGUBANG-like n=1 Tax=Rhodamnia argentea TaxID=178133 RepID=A0A8B8NVF7_9MYRT|nr:protein JINGUBANG-like [Rhodamnia argentea]XP_030526512.1 protein JINGUBANG-like [Rhodamnia argentea]XP_030526513.1 protein JINGUBANG-like [Rhodamnia argentea]